MREPDSYTTQLDRELTELRDQTRRLDQHLAELSPDALSRAREAMSLEGSVQAAVAYLAGQHLTDHLSADYVGARLRTSAPGELVNLTHTDGRITAQLIIEINETMEPLRR